MDIFVWTLLAGFVIVFMALIYDSIHLFYVGMIIAIVSLVLGMLTMDIDQKIDTATVHVESAVVTSISLDTFIADNETFAYSGTDELSLGDVALIEWSFSEGGDKVVNSIEILKSKGDAEDE